MPEEPGIYRLRNTVTGDTYIGSAESLRRRVSEHVSAMQKGEHLNRGIARLCKEHGADSFVAEVVMRCDYHDLFSKELFAVNRFRPSLNRCLPPNRTKKPKSAVDMCPLVAEIDDDLHRRLRVEAINRGVTVKMLVADAVRLLLGEKPQLPAKPKVK